MIFHPSNGDELHGADDRGAARGRVALLGLRFGAAAVRLVAERQFGMMVALQPPRILPVPIEEALAKPRRVPLDSDSVATARDLGVSFGD